MKPNAQTNVFTRNNKDIDILVTEFSSNPQRTEIQLHELSFFPCGNFRRLLNQLQNGKRERSRVCRKFAQNSHPTSLLKIPGRLGQCVRPNAVCPTSRHRGREIDFVQGGAQHRDGEEVLLVAVAG